MTVKFFPVYAARVWRMGSSVVFPLAKAILEAIGAAPGTLLLVKVHPPYVTFRVVNPDRDVPAWRKALDELHENARKVGVDVRGVRF